MSGLLRALASGGGAALWFVGMVVVSFMLFVGVAVFVTLFHPDGGRRRHARAVLRDLLDLVRGARK